ncbi:MAG: hypothetical protein V4490_02465, partial [Pseudomonadota bacterium]
HKSLATLVAEIVSYLNSTNAVTRETRWSKCLYLCRIGGWKTPSYMSSDPRPAHKQQSAENKSWSQAQKAVTQ